MAKVTCSLNPKLIEKVKVLAEKEGKSFSGMMADLVELGIRVSELTGSSGEDKTAQAWEDLYHNQVKASFQSLEMNREILRMVYNRNNSNFSQDFGNAEELIQGIRTQINSKVDTKVSGRID